MISNYLNKNTLRIGCILFLLFEIYFSFHRYKYFPLDGDIPNLVYSYQEVKSNPFGFNILLHDSSYGNPNRYFAVMSASGYFVYAPKVFQLIASPVKSIYLSCAFAKTLTRFLLIYLIAIIITGKRKFWDFDILIISTLLAPLFQIFGYHQNMGVIDDSITYTFFYGFAFCAVLLFFVPFADAAFGRRSFRFSPKLMFGLLLLSIYNAFNGPLNPAVLLIASLLILKGLYLTRFFENNQMGIWNRISFSIRNTPVQPSIILILTILLCTYSLFIGQNNAEHSWETLTLNSRYERLWEGIKIYFSSWGILLLLIMTAVNVIIIMKNRNLSASTFVLKLCTLLLLFSLLYILLLPMGGYRSYRPFIVRNDTLIPFTIGLILMYGITTFHILKNVSSPYKMMYNIVILGVGIFYVISDTEIRKYNKCEINALEKIANSKDKIVFVENECTVVSWNKTLNYNESHRVADLLKEWGVTREKKLFFQH